MNAFAIEEIWRFALAAIPLAAIVAVVCRCLPCRPSTRHTLWLTLLLLFVLAPFLPGAPVPDLASLAGEEAGAVAAIPAVADGPPVTTGKVEKDEGPPRRALTDGEHGMAWPGPTYTLCAVLAELHGCEVREVPFAPDYSLPLDELVGAAASLTYVCNPNSPTATFVEVSDLADLARRLRGVLLIDEAYVDFASQNCLPLAGELPNVLVVRTLSKGYSLAGLRFGYAVGSPELIAGLSKAKDSFNVDALSVAAATAAIQDQAYFQQNVERVCRERERLSAGLTKLGIAPLPSQANFVFARCQSPPAGCVYRALKDRNILVRHFDQPGLSEWLRITVGTPDQNDVLLNELARIM